MVVKICDDFSFRVDIFEAFQLYMSLIFIPELLESIPSERSLKAAFQLYSINCMYSLREMKLSPSLSYALKVSTCYQCYSLSHSTGY